MVKRLSDLTFSIIALVLLSVVMAVVVVLVRIKLGSSIIFHQVRSGLNEKLFKMFKFRSLLNSTNTSGTLLSDAERLTSFGRALRAGGFDELPGLWNVIRGDMSLVGPKPLLVEYLPLYGSLEKLRHEVRSGITGWAQVNGRNIPDVD